MVFTFPLIRQPLVWAYLERAINQLTNQEHQDRVSEKLQKQSLLEKSTSYQKQKKFTVSRQKTFFLVSREFLYIHPAIIFFIIFLLLQGAGAYPGCPSCVPFSLRLSRVCPACHEGFARLHPARILVVSLFLLGAIVIRADFLTWRTFDEQMDTLDQTIFSQRRE